MVLCKLCLGMSVWKWLESVWMLGPPKFEWFMYFSLLSNKSWNLILYIYIYIPDSAPFNTALLIPVHTLADTKSLSLSFVPAISWADHCFWCLFSKRHDKRKEKRKRSIQIRVRVWPGSLCLLPLCRVILSTEFPSHFLFITYIFSISFFFFFLFVSF